MGKSSLPPGFRFNPTDVELVQYYLKRKVMGKRLHVKVIAEVDIYKCAPWDLPDKSSWRSGDLKWYFFSPREKKYASGARIKRATDCGYWKTTGKDRSVLYNAEVVGFIKTLIFHTGRAPRGERTNWVLYEYRLEDQNLVDMGVPQDSYVLCMVFQKDGIGPRNNTQYGAPFKEEDWTDDEVEIDVVPYGNMSEPDLVHANMSEPDPVHAYNMPEPDHVHVYMPEPDLVHANMPEPDPVHTNIPEPDPVHANMPEPDPVHANMTEPDPVHANMTEPDPVHANMTEPDPVHANMTEPDPVHANMTEPDPVHANMTEPDLVYGNMPDPFLVYPDMPQPDLVYANMSEPYLVFPSNYNNSIATRTNSLESGVSDILPPSSNVLQSVSGNYVTTEKPHVSTDDDILSMIDCFIEEEIFSMGDIGKNEVCNSFSFCDMYYRADNPFYSGGTNPIDDFQRYDIYEDLGDGGKDSCNFLNGHNSMCTPDQMPPGENELFLELGDLDKPLNGHDYLVTQHLPMFSPPRTFPRETSYEDSYFSWRDIL
ncbi:hypothetical protein M0R45_009420 [Rubus argutus]|uniref:NAC domain-containing protein n=1 Tax=Rubus argutus TaxID=59490 RepID=A0AAW1Y4E4_RUBAR